MPSVQRLLAVLTVLAGTAAGAYMIIDSRRPAPAAAPTATNFHSDGLSDSHDGFRAEPVTLPARRGPGVVALRIVGPGGPVTDFQRIHLEPVHMYVLLRLSAPAPASSTPGGPAPPRCPAPPVADPPR